MRKTIRTCSHCGQEQPLSQFQRKCLDHGGSVVCNTCAARTQRTLNAALDLVAAGNVDVDNLDWQEDAACVGWDPAVFFPERGEPTQPARAVCAECDVRAECLAYALVANEEYGMWGGMAGRERRQAARRKHLRLMAVAS